MRYLVYIVVFSLFLSFFSSVHATGSSSGSSSTCSGGWSTWSQCSCGTNPSKTRTCTSDGTVASLPCTKSSANCKPINCIPGPWAPWGACVAPCGATAGTRTQYRYILTPALNGGTCPQQNDLAHSQACEATLMECQAGDETSWSWLLSPGFIVGASLILWTMISLLMGWFCYRTHLKELENLQDLNE